MVNDICNTCCFKTASGCNRLVIAGWYGNNDRLGSYYKRGNECPYHKEGKPSTRSSYLSLGYNS